MDNAPSPANRPEVNELDPSKINGQAFARFGLIGATAFLISSTSPPGLVMATFGGILFINSVLSSVVALICRDKFLAPHFTRWDEAAAYFVASWVMGCFIDPVALEAAMVNAGMAP